MGGRVSLRMRLVLGAMAGSGIALAHVVAFRLAVPHEAEREALLHSTGHAWWPALPAIAVAGVVATFIHLALWRRSGGAPSLGGVLAHAAARLILVQVLGFGLLEFVERILSGHGPLDLVREPAFLIGVGLQVVVALAIAALVVLVTRMVEALVSAMRPRRARAPRALRPPSAVVYTPSHAHVALGGLTLRGPPSS
ncbi:MAG: hypothetical protein ACRDI0_06610 [Actinomycetota bacterium]